MTHYYFTTDTDKAFKTEYVIDSAIKTSNIIDLNYLFDTAKKLNKAIIHLTKSELSSRFLTREVIMPTDKMYRKTY